MTDDQIEPMPLSTLLDQTIRNNQGSYEVDTARETTSLFTSKADALLYAMVPFNFELIDRVVECGDGTMAFHQNRKLEWEEVIFEIKQELERCPDPCWQYLVTLISSRKLSTDFIEESKLVERLEDPHVIAYSRIVDGEVDLRSPALPEIKTDRVTRSVIESHYNEFRRDLLKSKKDPTYWAVHSEPSIPPMCDVTASCKACAKDPRLTKSITHENTSVWMRRGEKGEMQFHFDMESAILSTWAQTLHDIATRLLEVPGYKIAVGIIEDHSTYLRARKRNDECRQALSEILPEPEASLLSPGSQIIAVPPDEKSLSCNGYFVVAQDEEDDFFAIDKTTGEPIQLHQATLNLLNGMVWSRWEDVNIHGAFEKGLKSIMVIPIREDIQRPFR